ncbi:hypothetical protein DEU56DRAFT_836280 [Suillus clintonianus]|uniref:uncharacterized protein n=1 Tax=Suillus clintonianus TaxID=1904413 RepID=UPI001B87F67C|nr:uncharacterized protein DEU56DRAFT_836280 [Suillus clintonianus]KAG2119390.1 hypothetical protein DEU56DRAFT_836280 [Suillus clintonianus]
MIQVPSDLNSNNCLSLPVLLPRIDKCRTSLLPLLHHSTANNDSEAIRLECFFKGAGMHACMYIFSRLPFTPPRFDINVIPLRPLNDSGSPVVGMARVAWTNFCLKSVQSEKLIELLGLNHGYKGRALKITDYHATSQTFIISVSSTMPYPEAGIYLIQSSSQPDIYASLHNNHQRVLRAEYCDIEQYSQLWRLEYVENDTDSSKAYCIISKPDTANPLGVNTVHTNQAVYSMLDESDVQSWYLSETDEGYVIGQSANNKQYTWRHGAKGEPIVITSHDTQSWKFVAPE